IYGENSSCAGRALRNIIIVQAADLIKDRANLKGFYRRSCVGSELVDWLLEHCPFVQCRSMAIGVWQLLLDMGILSSVDQHLYFQDTYVFYQFSSDECSYLYCEFEREEEWQNGVRLLLQLVPLIPSRAGICELNTYNHSKDELLFNCILLAGFVALITVHTPISCIQPGLVICFTLDNIHVSMLFSRNIPPSPSPTESKRVGSRLRLVTGVGKPTGKPSIIFVLICVSLIYFYVKGDPPTLVKWASQWFKSHGQRSLVSYSPWGHKESDTTERLSIAHNYLKMENK
ncbi:hypothetical protein FD754_018503, partial [Muntiacus muntjak]